MKILLVDDNATVLSELEESLLSHEHQVVTAENGLSALSLAKDGQFDFVITDYKMPFMDGIKLIENLIQELDYSARQMLLLTTDASQAVEFKINKLNVKFLAKPVPAEKVVQTMMQSATFQAA